MKRLIFIIFVVFAIFTAQGAKLVSVRSIVEPEFVGVELSFDTRVDTFKINANPAKTVYSLVVEKVAGKNLLLPVQVGPLEAVSIVEGEGKLYVNFFHLIPVQRPSINLSNNSMSVRFRRARRFSKEEYVFTGEEVPLREVLKYIMGESYLNLNYVISEKLETEKIKLTMRLAGMGADDVFRDLLLTKSGRISYAYLPDGTLYLGTPEEVSQRVDAFWQTYGGVKLSESGIEELRSRLPMSTLVEYVPEKGILFVYGDLESHMKISQLLSTISPVTQMEYDYSRLSQYYDLSEIGKKVSDFLNRLKTGEEDGKPLIPDVEFSNVPEAGKAMIWVPEQDKGLLISLLQAFESNLINERRRLLKEETPSEEASFKTLEVKEEPLRNDVKAILELLSIDYKEISSGFAIKVSEAQFRQLSALKNEVAKRYQAPVTELRRISRYIDEDMAKVLADMVAPQRVEEFELVLLEGRKLSNVVKLKGRPDQIDIAVETVERALDVLGENEVKKLYKVEEENVQDLSATLRAAFPSLNVEVAGKDLLVLRGQKDVVSQAEDLLKSLKTPPQEHIEKFLELPSWAADMGFVDVLSTLFPSASLKYYGKIGILLVEIDQPSEKEFMERYRELFSLAKKNRAIETVEGEATSTTAETTSTTPPKMSRILPTIPGVNAESLKSIFSSKELEVEVQLIEPFGYLITGVEPDVEVALSLVGELKEKLSKRSYAVVSLKEGVDKTSLASLFSSLGIKVDLLNIGDKTLMLGEKSDVGNAKKLVENLSLEALEMATDTSAKGEPEKTVFQAFNLDPSVNVESLKSLLSKLGYEVEFVQIGRQWVAVGSEEGVNAVSAIIDELNIRVIEEATATFATPTSVSTKTVEEKTFEIVKLESLDPVELINVLKLFYPTITTASFEKLGILILMGNTTEVEKAIDMVKLLKSMAKERETLEASSATEEERQTAEIGKAATPSTAVIEKGQPEEVPFKLDILPDGTFALDVKDQQLGLVLEIVAEKLGRSLMMIDYPQEKLNLKASGMSWDGLLNLVEEFYPYTVLKRNGVTVIQRKSPSAATETTTSTKKYVLRISHNIEEVARLVEFYGGTVYTDDANELMVITGIPEEVYEALSGLVESLSSPKPVVKISARIVDRSLLDDFNVSLSSLLDLGHAGMSLNSEGGRGQITIDSRIIDLLDYRKLMEALAEKLQLSANTTLQSVISDGDILSEPQITTVSGKEAKIFVGQKIPYVQGYDENNKPIIAFAEPGIELDITPQVRKDGTISLSIFVKVSDVEYYNPTADLTYPIEKTRQAETNVIVTENQAVVIGGLVRTSETVQENRLPFLGSLPFLGNLFKSESKKKEKSDLLIFITAEVVNPGS